MPFDVHALRAQFPALQESFHGRPGIFFDNPGGTQVPQSVVDAMSRYLLTSNANTHGEFATSRRSDEIIVEAHTAMADLLNADGPDEIVFGQNMTSLTFAMSRALGRTLEAGDEIVSVEGKGVGGPGELGRVLSGLPVGRRVRLAIRRARPEKVIADQTVAVELGLWPFRSSDMYMRHHLSYHPGCICRAGW